MAARGTEAKKIIADKIISALSDCYIGEDNKKYYFSARENGENVQVCISMTCPKTPIEQSSARPVAKASAENFDWSTSTPVATTPPAATEISEADAAKVDELMRRLGISD